ncbi:LYR motif-containing protein 4B [Liparis tanakae]|uniref:LYR motif-containing protein 4B n=1 Tax=Liparis tanakae TaxID=230148 RepID=A0A4Z2E8S7_9TELE|nr:LYR motif-containing protein 4B [Liparis tanakae]
MRSAFEAGGGANGEGVRGQGSGPASDPAWSREPLRLRRVRDAFRANRKVEDPQAVERLMVEGQQTLALIQRQVRHTQVLEVCGSRGLWF